MATFARNNSPAVYVFPLNDPLGILRARLRFVPQTQQLTYDDGGTVFIPNKSPNLPQIPVTSAMIAPGEGGDTVAIMLPKENDKFLDFHPLAPRVPFMISTTRRYVWRLVANAAHWDQLYCTTLVGLRTMIMAQIEVTPRSPSSHIMSQLQALDTSLNQLAVDYVHRAFNPACWAKVCEASGTVGKGTDQNTAKSLSYLHGVVQGFMARTFPTILQFLCEHEHKRLCARSSRKIARENVRAGLMVAIVATLQATPVPHGFSLVQLYNMRRGNLDLSLVPARLSATLADANRYMDIVRFCRAQAPTHPLQSLLLRLDAIHQRQ